MSKQENNKPQNKVNLTDFKDYKVSKNKLNKKQREYIKNTFLLDLFKEALQYKNLNEMSIFSDKKIVELVPNADALLINLASKTAINFQNFYMSVLDLTETLKRF